MEISGRKTSYLYYEKNTTMICFRWLSHFYKLDEGDCGNIDTGSEQSAESEKSEKSEKSVNSALGTVEK